MFFYSPYYQRGLTNTSRLHVIYFFYKTMACIKSGDVILFSVSSVQETRWFV